MWSALIILNHSTLSVCRTLMTFKEEGSNNFKLFFPEKAPHLHPLPNGSSLEILKHTNNFKQPLPDPLWLYAFSLSFLNFLDNAVPSFQCYNFLNLQVQINLQ